MDKFRKSQEHLISRTFRSSILSYIQLILQRTTGGQQYGENHVFNAALEP